MHVQWVKNGYSIIEIYVIRDKPDVRLFPRWLRATIQTDRKNIRQLELTSIRESTHQNVLSHLILPSCSCERPRNCKFLRNCCETKTNEKQLARSHSSTLAKSNPLLHWIWLCTVAWGRAELAGDRKCFPKSRNLTSPNVNSYWEDETVNDGWVLPILQTVERSSSCARFENCWGVSSTNKRFSFQFWIGKVLFPPSFLCAYWTLWRINLRHY